MRRQEREITDLTQIRAFLAQCTLCRVGFWDGEEVYILPMNFGLVWEGETPVLYFHGAKEGRKADLARGGARVGFEIDNGYTLETGSIACAYSAVYESVIGSGVFEPVEDPSEKRLGLTAVMEQSAGKGDWSFSEDSVAGVGVYRLTVTKMTCKARKSNT